MKRTRTKDPFLEYRIPSAQIAQEPADRRDGSRLMVVKRQSGSIEDSKFEYFHTYLKSDDVLVINDTRVIPAKVAARKKTTGGRVGLLFLEWTGLRWRAMVKGTVRDGSLLTVDGWPEELKIVRNNGGQVEIESPHPEDPLFFFDRVGSTPLPPYIHRCCETERESQDRLRYQTVYAHKDGSVAAPTAGLHFTEAMVKKIENKGISIVRVTLHIGWGTFSPVRGDYRKHNMHREWGNLSKAGAAVLNAALTEGRRIVAVGTTTVRLLESGWNSTQGVVDPVKGPVSLYITPGYDFKVVGALLTNFHRPRSTLLLLVNALAGADLTRKAYTDAISRGYRFHSYGDAMFIC